LRAAREVADVEQDVEQEVTGKPDAEADGPDVEASGESPPEDQETTPEDEDQARMKAE
jgi:hypothetical protein